jgi:predicted O-methyltransferase YrrM
VDTDWGCTVIRPGVRARSGPPRVRRELGWADLEGGRQELLNLVSVPAFRRDLVAEPFRTRQRPLTSRTELINALISAAGFERYLEVGVGSGDHFRQVIAPIRHGIDPAGDATFPMTSDAFFGARLGCDAYDLIFIDGLHEEDQCVRDLDHALERLAPAGLIVLHDANPPTEWHQRPVAEAAPGEEWNGTVWRALVRFRAAHPQIRVVTADLDWGCAVIRPDATPRAGPVDVPDPLDWHSFAAHRDRLLGLVPPDWPQLAAAVMER